MPSLRPSACALPSSRLAARDEPPEDEECASEDGAGLIDDEDVRILSHRSTEHNLDLLASGQRSQKIVSSSLRDRS